MKRVIPVVILLFILVFTAAALAVEIRGVVIDQETEEPLAGVNVYIKGQPIGTATDDDGYFFFDYETDQDFTLVFEYLGYKPFEMKVSPTQDLTNLKVELVEDVFRSEEIVVTSIASETAKARAEVAVARVRAEELTVRNVYSDISQLLTAKVAGVYIKPSSGNVGSGFRFRVRSSVSLNGNEQPVIYVDGVRVDDSQVDGFYVGGQGISLLSDLNPDDIEKIEVLKGPAGAAMYGTDGANGVILITTKRGKLLPGKTGGIALEYRVSRGWNQQAYKYQEKDGLSYKDANAIFRTGDKLEQFISASGGTGFLRYYASFDRQVEAGILRNNDMDRRTAKLNLDAYPSEKLTFSANASYTLNILSRPNNDNNIYGYLGNTLLFAQSYRFTDSASIEGLKDKWRGDRFTGSFRVTYNPIEKLEFRGSVGLDRSNFREDQTFPADLVYAFVPQGRRRIFNRRSNQVTWDVNLRYRFNPFTNLTVTSVAGAQLFERRTFISWLEAERFATGLITDIGAGADFTGKGEGKSHLKKSGIFTEHQFNYGDQYFFTLGLRQEYASSIGPKAPTILYPKASMAVRIDRYGFMPRFVGLFKVRAAYGETGILPDPTDPIPLLWTALSSAYGSGAVLSAIGNEQIKPERIQEFEVGFEAEIFTDYAVEFTYYRQNALNSIIGFANAPSTGKTASTVPFNVGRAEGWGLEGVLNAAPLKTRWVSVDLTVTAAYQQNEVKDLGGAQPIYDPFDINVVKEGLPKYEFYTWKVLGANYNADGKYIGPKLSDERVSFGNPVPTFFGSVSTNIRIMRDLNLYIMAEWATGQKIFNNTRLFATRFGNIKEYNDLRDQLSQLEDNGQLGTDEYKAVAERLAFLDWRADANFIEDADFLKIREISLSYDVSRLLSKFMTKQYVKRVMLGVNFRNWFTWTKYSGADVEVNFAGARSLVRGQDFLTLQNPKSANLFLRISL